MDLESWKSQGQTFRYRGHDVFYRRSGAGPTLVLIHGFPTASWDWHRVWEGLTARYDVVAPDMLGFGFSDKPRQHDYSIVDQASLHEALLRELDVDTVHVLAHDYGDSVAQELLARHADRHAAGADPAGIEIRSMTLLNGGILPGTHRPLRIQRLLMSPIGGILVHVLRRSSLRRSFRRIFGPRTQPTEREIDDFWRLIEYGDGRRIFHKLIRYMAEREVRKERWTGVLQTTTVPLRLVNGSHDPISGAHVVRHYRRHVRNPDVVELAGIGHYPQIEAPDAVYEATIDHIERHRG